MQAAKKALARRWLPCVGAIIILTSSRTASYAQGLPPISVRMIGKAVQACIMVTESGKLGGAYLLGTSGDDAADRDMLAWVKKLHWNPAKPDEKMRNVWFTTGLAFGGAKAPEAVAECKSP